LKVEEKSKANEFPNREKGNGQDAINSTFSVWKVNKEVPTMYYYWGMHGYWWFFWIVLWILFFAFLMPVRRTYYRQMQSPLQILQRRYAAGEITSEEYEERRTKLQRDVNMK
jgi:putative membrane protein